MDLGYRPKRRRSRLIGSLPLALGMLLLMGTLPVRSQLPEYQVKAAFLINIAKYADWPAHALPSGAPLIIVIVGDDPFGGSLDSLATGRRVSDHEIIVRRVSRASDLPHAHVIFVSRSAAESIAAIRSASGAANALLVGDSELTADYATINFSVLDGRIVFEVNLGAAEAAGVKVSSKLLHLARSVRQPRSRSVLRR